MGTAWAHSVRAYKHAVFGHKYHSSDLPVCSLHVRMKLAITHAKLIFDRNFLHIFTRAPANLTWAQARVCPSVATPLITNNYIMQHKQSAEPNHTMTIHKLCNTIHYSFFQIGVPPSFKQVQYSTHTHEQCFQILFTMSCQLLNNAINYRLSSTSSKVLYC